MACATRPTPIPPRAAEWHVKNFVVDPRRVAEALLASGFLELPISVMHAARVAALPPIHQDPFDRMLIAQSQVEPMMLLTVDVLLGRYGATVKSV